MFKKNVNKAKKKSPNTAIPFSYIIIRKDRKNLEKSDADTNSRLKNYCKQKNIGFTLIRLGFLRVVFPGWGSI